MSSIEYFFIYLPHFPIKNVWKWKANSSTLHCAIQCSTLYCGRIAHILENVEGLPCVQKRKCAYCAKYTYILQKEYKYYGSMLF